MGPSIVPGTVLGGTFTIIRLIGRGGMGEVYEAEHVRLKGRVAVKLLRSDVARDTEAYQRLRDEAQLTSALRHPHIVQVLDFDQHENLPFIVMERLEGCDLAWRVKNDGPMPLKTVVPMVEQVSSALSAAHAKGIIHRDLKPQNIFLVRMPELGQDFAKVMDFGISMAMSEVKVNLDGTHSSVLGTPPYMSPEQVLGAPELDGRSDQFALATIAYEALCGRPAFSGNDADTVFHEVLHKQPRGVSKRMLNVPEAVDHAIRRGMAKNRDERFPSIVEFARALRTAARMGAPPSDPMLPQPVQAVTGEATERLGVQAAAPVRTPVTLVEPLRVKATPGPVSPPPPAAPLAAPQSPDAPTPTPTPAPGRDAAAASGIYVLVREGAGVFSTRFRRLATIALASLIGGIVALGLAAIMLRREIADVRRRAAEAAQAEAAAHRAAQRQRAAKASAQSPAAAPPQTTEPPPTDAPKAAPAVPPS